MHAVELPYHCRKFVLGVFSLIGFFSCVWGYVKYFQESFPKTGGIQTAYDAFFEAKKRVPVK